MTWRPLRRTPEQSAPMDLAQSLDRLTRSLGAPTSRVLRTVFASWAEIVGEALARHAQPVSIRDGTLTVAVADASWATELRWLAPELLERLGTAAGEPVASRIQVRVTGRPVQPSANRGTG